MLKILKLKVEQSVFFSGAGAGGAEQASAQQRASSGAQRPRGMARGCVRRLHGGPSVGARGAAAAQREERAARGQTAAGGEQRRLGKREEFRV